jgi:hypothetical protein
MLLPFQSIVHPTRVQDGVTNAMVGAVVGMGKALTRIIVASSLSFTTQSVRRTYLEPPGLGRAGLFGCRVVAFCEPTIKRTMAEAFFAALSFVI